jgi:hypothetical protein
MDCANKNGWVYWFLQRRRLEWSNTLEKYTKVNSSGVFQLDFCIFGPQYLYTFHKFS